MEPQTTGNKRSVLLVEDNETYRKAVRLAMEVAGFTILEAENGKRGLELIKMQTPAIVLCDIHMPEMDGLALLSEVKKDPALSTVPIIMLTNIQEEIEHSVKAGADEAILKSSLTPHQVVDVCLKHLSETPQTSETSPPVSS